MGWRFVADFANGYGMAVGIQNGNSRHSFQNPWQRPQDFAFHSAFGYMTTIQNFYVSEMTFPAIQPQFNYKTFHNKQKGKRRRSVTVEYPVALNGFRSHFVGQLTGEWSKWDTEPVLLFYEFNGEQYHMGNMPIYPPKNGSMISKIGTHYRILSTAVAPYGDGWGVYIVERYSIVGRPAIPQQTIKNIRVLRTAVRRGRSQYQGVKPPDAPKEYILKITPTEFEAGYNQVNLTSRFIREGIDPAGNTHYIGHGNTLLFDSKGAAVFIIPSASETGYSQVIESGGVGITYDPGVKFRRICL